MQIWVLDKNPYKAVSLLTDKLVRKMLVEQLQLLSTFYKKKGICEDFMYKSIPQGKELVNFIEDNLHWNLHYLNALVKESFERFGDRANTYKSVKVAYKFLKMFYIYYAIPSLTYISFRCKKEYIKHDKLNKKNLSIEKGILEYNNYYEWNITRNSKTIVKNSVTKESLC